MIVFVSVKDISSKETCYEIISYSMCVDVEVETILKQITVLSVTMLFNERGGNKYMR